MKKLNVLLIGTSIFLLGTNFSSAKKFSDVNNDNPYYTTTRYLSAKNIINGYQDDTFKPEQKITRAELLKIVFEGNKSKTTEPTTNCFPDVGYKEWYSKYICTAKNLKIIDGYKDGKFKPDQNISKVEALKIIGEFYKWEMEEDKSNKNWYSKYLKYSSTTNLLTESANNLAIDEPINRGDLAAIIYRFLATKEYKATKFSEEIDNKVGIKIAAEDIANEKDSEKNSEVISRNLPTPQIVKLTPGEIKIVLSWEQPEIKPEEEKTQFNSYLLQPTDEEISFKHKIDNKLDTILETKGNTETFTIRKIKTDGDKDYLYFVESINGETTFLDAKMKIEVYDKKGLVKTIMAYKNTDRIWKVFTLNKDYEMRIFNSIGDCSLIRDSESCPEVVESI